MKIEPILTIEEHDTNCLVGCLREYAGATDKKEAEGEMIQYASMLANRAFDAGREYERKVNP